MTVLTKKPLQVYLRKDQASGPTRFGPEARYITR
jgi:hypothetical protein